PSWLLLSSGNQTWRLKAYLKLVFEFSIYRVWSGFDTAYLMHRYAVSSLMDTEYWLSEQ
ncbi:hypothetical protein Tco_0451128, partial [Tanacetum coccineum]